MKLANQKGNVAVLLAGVFSLASFLAAKNIAVSSISRSRWQIKKLDTIEGIYASEVALISKHGRLLKLVEQRGNYRQWLVSEGATNNLDSFPVTLSNEALIQRNPGDETSIFVEDGRANSLMDTLSLDKGVSRFRRYTAGSLIIVPPTRNVHQPDLIQTGPQRICGGNYAPTGVRTDVCLRKEFVLPPETDLKVAAPSGAFTDGPITVAHNSRVTLQWTARNVSSCQLSPMGWTGLSHTGRQTGQLTTNQDFEITCDGYGGRVTDRVSVRVLPAPNPIQCPLHLNPNHGIQTQVANTNVLISVSQSRSVCYRAEPTGSDPCNFMAVCNDGDPNSFCARIPVPGHLRNMPFWSNKEFMDFRIADIRDPNCQPQFVGFRSDIGCFAPDTLIRMADGSQKPIHKIYVGDLVWNPITEKAYRVRNLTAGPEKIPMYRVVAGNNSLLVTKTHPFMTTSGVKQAAELVDGDRLVLPGKEALVSAVEVYENQEQMNVWNLELDSDSDAAEHHMVLADGIPAGDLFLQTELETLRRGRK